MLESQDTDKKGTLNLLRNTDNGNNANTESEIKERQKPTLHHQSSENTLNLQRRTNIGCGSSHHVGS